MNVEQSANLRSLLIDLSPETSDIQVFFLSLYSQITVELTRKLVQQCLVLLNDLVRVPA